MKKRISYGNETTFDSYHIYELESNTKGVYAVKVVAGNTNTPLPNLDVFTSTASLSDAFDRAEKALVSLPQNQGLIKKVI